MINYMKELISELENSKKFVERILSGDIPEENELKDILYEIGVKLDSYKSLEDPNSPLSKLYNKLTR